MHVFYDKNKLLVIIIVIDKILL